MVMTHVTELRAGDIVTYDDACEPAIITAISDVIGERRVLELVTAAEGSPLPSVSLSRAGDVFRHDGRAVAHLVTNVWPVPQELRVAGRQQVVGAGVPVAWIATIEGPGDLGAGWRHQMMILETSRAHRTGWETLRRGMRPVGDAVLPSTSSVPTFSHLR